MASPTRALLVGSHIVTSSFSHQLSNYATIDTAFSAADGVHAVEKSLDAQAYDFFVIDDTPNPGSEITHRNRQEDYIYIGTQEFLDKLRSTSRYAHTPVFSIELDIEAPEWRNLRAKYAVKRIVPDETGRIFGSLRKALHEKGFTAKRR